MKPHAPPKPPGRPPIEPSGTIASITIGLAPAHRDALERGAKRLKVTRSQYLRKLIERTTDWTGS